MFGWRARIGYINPGVYLHSQEWDRILPQGVVWAMFTLGVRSLVREEFERAFNLYISAGETLASREVDFIICAGMSVHMAIGHDKSLEMAKRIQEITGIPTMLQSTAITNAFNKLSVKKLVMVSPFAEENNEAHKRYFEDEGFNVLAIKSLGIRDNNDLTKQPLYASYKLAYEAFHAAPEAEAIYIACSAWPVLPNIDIIEKDFGKPVITDMTASAWMPLTALNIKTPVKGYGRLMEMI
ncbi:hypothetical protein ACFLYV_01170 [Chloroflexota bacterium]